MDGSDEAISVIKNLNSGKWDMYINIGVINDSKKGIVFTLAHEFAHILTLNNSQVDETTQSAAQ